MDVVDMVAVVGACGPERLRHAKGLAVMSNRSFLTVPDLGDSDPISEAIDLLRWRQCAAGTVVEFPADTDVLGLIGAVAAGDVPIRLVAIVCVVDAVHLLDDLDRDDYVVTSPVNRHNVTAAALLIARQIEYASAVVLVNWTSLPTGQLSALMALISHLGPQAHLSLHGDDLTFPPTSSPYTSGQDRPGWVRLVNGDFDPRMTDTRVSALRYEHLRPLHPFRMERLLYTIESGCFGKVIRSVGFCRLASRPNVVAQWDHVGRMVVLAPLAVDGTLGVDEEMLAIGQELAFIGLDLDVDGLCAALDDAMLTDEEFQGGPKSWLRFADPFPPWSIASERAD
ncbi:GTP-binding protein [Mycobacterium sp. 155]|uniref:GTP-binding protein n=1 Tax=Mycobacterium sp. 155 TaxID=1157943 RepID=UPI00036606C0|nr:GTP-binding protein [Mycobacterium sp. 155]